MAHNILAYAATGVGIEQLFSIACQQASFNQTYFPKTFKARIIIVEFYQ